MYLKYTYLICFLPSNTAVSPVNQPIDKFIALNINWKIFIHIQYAFSATNLSFAINSPETVLLKYAGTRGSLGTLGSLGTIGSLGSLGPLGLRRSFGTLL